MVPFEKIQLGGRFWLGFRQIGPSLSEKGVGVRALGVHTHSTLSST